MRCPEKAETSVRIGPFPPCLRGPDVAGYLVSRSIGCIVQFESAVSRRATFRHPAAQLVRVQFLVMGRKRRVIGLPVQVRSRKLRVAQSGRAEFRGSGARRATCP